MNESKVWVVIGAGDGLGTAAIKYLVSKKQITIAMVSNSDTYSPFYEDEPYNLHIIKMKQFDVSAFKELLQEITAIYGLIHVVINNSNYHLVNMLHLKDDTEIQKKVSSGIAGTTQMIKNLIPYLCKEPKGRIINLPPQFCKATLPEGANAGILLAAIDTFLQNLHNALLKLDCRLSFLKPGEQLSGFSDAV